VATGLLQKLQKLSTLGSQIKTFALKASRFLLAALVPPLLTLVVFVHCVVFVYELPVFPIGPVHLLALQAIDFSNLLHLVCGFDGLIEGRFSGKREHGGWFASFNSLLICVLLDFHGLCEFPQTGE
jgi:hypothetical protein